MFEKLTIFRYSENLPVPAAWAVQSYRAGPAAVLATEDSLCLAPDRPGATISGHPARCTASGNMVKVTYWMYSFYTT